MVKKSISWESIESNTSTEGEEKGGKIEQTIAEKTNLGE
jgi:hypothetical protein